MYDWTIMVYMAGDNSLSDHVIQDINDMEAGAPSVNDNFRVVIQMDRRRPSPDENWKGAMRCPVWKQDVIQKGKISTPESERKYLGDLDFADKSVLKDFIFSSVATYPAKRYMLILWSHGYGIDDSNAVDFNTAILINESLIARNLPSPVTAWPSLRELSMSWQNPELLAKVIEKGAVEDIHGTMSNPTLGKILREAGASLPNGKFDIIGFDACNMASLEVASELRGSADILIASENLVPPRGLPYSDVFLYIKEKIWEENASIRDAETLAQSIVKKYILSSAQDNIFKHAYTISAVALDRLDNLIAAIDSLSRSLIPSLEGEQRMLYINTLKEINDKVEKFGPSNEEAMIDLGHLAILLKNSGILNEMQQAEADKLHYFCTLRDSASCAVIAEGHSEVEHSRINSTGLTIFFPNFENPKIFKGYSSLEFMQYSWDEFIKTCFDIQPLFIIENKVERLSSAEEREFKVSISIQNVNEFAHIPSRISVNLRVRDDFLKDKVKITPVDNIMLHDPSKKNLIPDFASFQLSFSDILPPLTYLLRASLESNGKTLTAKDDNQLNILVSI